MKKLYFVAGEMSGDTHGAAVMTAMRATLGEVAFGGVGGPKMAGIPGAEGMEDWLEEAAVLGVWEVLKKYGYFRREFRRVLDEIEAWQPEAVILIDYPGFNLRLAKALRAKRPGLKIIYYISPQVWAWNRGRVGEMARMLDLMICIFPFEEPLYESSGLRTIFAGHPMVDALTPEKGRYGREEGIVGLFPGSRRREVDKHFEVLLEAAARVRDERPGTRFVAAAANDSLRREMERMREGSSLSEEECEVVPGRTHELMQRATCAAIASGTATLEASFFELPYCLIYRVAWPTWLAGKMLVKVEHLGMANILAGREVVPEFIQGRLTPGHVADELLRLLNSSEARERVTRDLREVIGNLGGAGAHERAADAILSELEQDSNG